MSIVWLILLLIDSSSQLENGYGYQTGQISLNDSEITILINSTFEIIEDFDNDTSINPEEASTEDVTTSPTKSPIRLKKIRPVLIQCQQFSEAQKYKFLEDVGGRNQFFMANSVDEAAQNFADFFPPSPTDQTFQDHVEIQPSDKKNHCDSRCQKIKNALNKEIQRRNSTSSQSDSSIFKTQFNDASSNSSLCALGNFIPIGPCTDLGEPVNGGSQESLCSECRGLYMMTSNCFPQFFNAVHCNSQEMGCIFDAFTDMAHGQCTLQTLTFKVLRNNGDENCENWIAEQLQLPVACQCALSKSSFLKSKPSREL